MSAHRKLAASTLAVALVFVGAGCGGSDAKDAIDEEAIENATGGDVDIDSDDNSVKYTDEEGNVTELGGTELPEGWPEELTPPDSVTLISSSKQTQDGKETLYALGEAEGTITEYYEGLKQQITDADLEIQSDNMIDSGAGSYAGITATSDDYEVTASVTEGDAEGKVTISVAITKNPA